MSSKADTISKPRLYNYFRSSSSYRVRLALSYKGIDYDYIPIHLLKKEQFSLSFRSLNPMGQVPCWEDPHVGALSQSMAILLYIESQYPEPALLPKQKKEQARVVEFCEIINTTQPLHNVGTLNALTDLFQASEEQKTQWMHLFLKKSWEALETWVNKYSKQYCFGDQVSLADCFLLPHAFASERFGLNLATYARGHSLVQGLLRQNWVKKAHPYYQPDTPEDLRSP